MTILKKTAANKTTGKKIATAKVKAQKTSVAKKMVPKKATSDKPAIKKGSKLSCQLCGFAFTVDHLSNSVEEADLICCEIPSEAQEIGSEKEIDMILDELEKHCTADCFF